MSDFYDVEFRVKGVPTNFDKIKESINELKRPVIIDLQLDKNFLTHNPFLQKITSAQAFTLNLVIEENTLRKQLTAIEERVNKIQLDIGAATAGKQIDDLTKKLEKLMGLTKSASVGQMGRALGSVGTNYVQTKGGQRSIGPTGWPTSMRYTQAPSTDAKLVNEYAKEVIRGTFKTAKKDLDRYIQQGLKESTLAAITPKRLGGPSGESISSGNRAAIFSDMIVKQMVKSADASQKRVDDLAKELEIQRGLSKLRAGDAGTSQAARKLSGNELAAEAKRKEAALIANLTRLEASRSKGTSNVPTSPQSTKSGEIISQGMKPGSFLTQMLSETSRSLGKAGSGGFSTAAEGHIPLLQQVDRIVQDRRKGILDSLKGKEAGLGGFTADIKDDILRVNKSLNKKNPSASEIIQRLLANPIAETRNSFSTRGGGISLSDQLDALGPDYKTAPSGIMDRIRKSGLLSFGGGGGLPPVTPGSGPSGPGDDPGNLNLKRQIVDLERARLEEIRNRLSKKDVSPIDFLRSVNADAPKFQAEVLANSKLRKKSAEDFMLYQNPNDFGGMVGLKAAARAKFGTDAGITPQTFDVRRLGNAQSALGVLLAAQQGPLEGIGAAIGATTRFGQEGQIFGTAIGGALQFLADKATEAGRALFDAGLTFNKSLLGLAAIGQQNTNFVGANGSPLPIRDQLNLQQSRARDIQLAARSKLLPLGIAGQTETTFVQGTASALSQRGFDATPEQIARISELIGGTIQTQRPGLLENSTLLLRDLQDLISGGPQANRVLLSSLIGRNTTANTTRAKNAQEFISALEAGGLGAQVDAAKNADNIGVSINKLYGAFDQFVTKGGIKLVDQVSNAFKSLSDTLSADAETGGGITKSVETISTALGMIGGLFTVASEAAANFIANQGNNLDAFFNGGTQNEESFETSLFKKGTAFLPDEQRFIADQFLGQYLSKKTNTKGLLSENPELKRFLDSLAAPGLRKETDLLRKKRTAELQQTEQSKLLSELNSVGLSEEFTKFKEEEGKSPRILEGRLTDAIKRLQDKSADQPGLVSSDTFDFISRRLTGLKNERLEERVKGLIDNTPEGQLTSASLGSAVSANNQTERDRFRLSLEERIKTVTEDAKKLVSTGREKDLKASEEVRKRIKDIDDKIEKETKSKAPSQDRIDNLEERRKEILEKEFKPLEESLKTLQDPLKVAADLTKEYKEKLEELNREQGVSDFDTYKRRQMSLSAEAEIGKSNILGGGGADASRSFIDRFFAFQKLQEAESAIQGLAGDNSSEGVARRLRANADRTSALGSIYSSDRSREARDEMIAGANANVSESYKKLQEALGNEFEQRKKLNDELGNSVAALQEFNNQASLRSLNVIQGGVDIASRAKGLFGNEGGRPGLLSGLGSTFYGSQNSDIGNNLLPYSSLLGNLPTESLTAAQNPGFAKEVARRKLQEEADAYGREADKAPMTAQQQQAKLQESVDNNRTSLDKLTSSIDELRKQFETAKKTREELTKVDSINPFPTVTGQPPAPLTPPPPINPGSPAPGATTPGPVSPTPATGQAPSNQGPTPWSSASGKDPGTVEVYKNGIPRPIEFSDPDVDTSSPLSGGVNLGSFGSSDSPTGFIEYSSGGGTLFFGGESNSNSESYPNMSPDSFKQASENLSYGKYRLPNSEPISEAGLSVYRRTRPQPPKEEKADPAAYPPGYSGPTTVPDVKDVYSMTGRTRPTVEVAPKDHYGGGDRVPAPAFDFYKDRILRPGEMPKGINTAEAVRAPLSADELANLPQFKRDPLTGSISRDQGDYSQGPGNTYGMTDGFAVGPATMSMAMSAFSPKSSEPMTNTIPWKDGSVTPWNKGGKDLFDKMTSESLFAESDKKSAQATADKGKSGDQLVIEELRGLREDVKKVLGKQMADNLYDALNRQFK